MKSKLAKKVNDVFTKFAMYTSNLLGNAWVCLLGILLVGIWLVVGLLNGFSSQWESVLNITITIITFIIVFFIQNTQNRDSAIINLKLNELIRSQKEARNATIDLDDLSDEELLLLQENYKKICKNCQETSELDKN